VDNCPRPARAIRCGRLTGGAFSAQARFPAEAVTLAGAFQTWERVGDSGRRAWFHWCPNCGATVMFVNEGYEDMPAIPIGAFADDDAPTPTLSIFEESKLAWVAVAGEGIEHFA
jgi:hypothetical protein